MSRHVVIVGGGAALAGPLINHFVDNEGGRDDRVTAICRERMPNAGDIPARLRDRLRVRVGIDMGDDSASALLELEPADVLITLPGAVSNAKLKGMTCNQWESVINATLTSVFNALRFCPLKNGGNVVVVGSIMGNIGCYGAANYAAAKAGLVGLVKTAAWEMASRGICVNLLALGFVNAGMGNTLPDAVRSEALKSIPLGRFAEPDEVVEAIEFLSRTQYMTGNSLNFAGGL